MWSLFHSRTAQALGSWIGILSAVFTVLGRLTPEWFGELTWPQSILLGIGLALAASIILAIVLAVGAWGFRLIKPLSVSEAKGRTRKSLSDDQIRNVVQGNAETLRNQFDSLAVLANRVAAIEAEIEGTKDGAESLRAGVQSFMSAAVSLTTDLYKKLEAALSAQDQARLSAVGSLSSDITEIRRACATLEETLKQNEKKLRESLYAIWARERMNELAAVIEQDADDLYRRLKDGENYTVQDWDRWVNVHHHWEQALNEWINVSRWYAKDVKKDVLTIDDKEYSGPWTVRDEQFPNADAVWRFKRHRIIQSHWESVRGQADKGVHMVAFSGLTEQEQHRGQYHQ